VQTLFRANMSVVFSVVLCLLLGSSVWAGPVSAERAQKVTQAFLRARMARRLQGAGTFSVAAENQNRQVLTTAGCREIRDDDGSLLAYVTELEPHGFVVTSADTELSPIVAYSLRSPFPAETDKKHPLSQLLRADLMLRLGARAEGGRFAAAENDILWDRYASGAGEDDEVFQQWPPEGTTATGGWLETTWHQDEPFNALCPLDPVDGLRSYVGCVATAMAQVVHYHRQGSMSFDASDSYATFGGIDVDADSGRYDFPSFEELNDALTTVRFKYLQGSDLDDTDTAALSAACGFAVLMDYSSEGSGAYTYAIQAALLDKCGFHSADLIGGLSREFLPVLHENLINQLPVIFGIGYPSDGGGHIIVCDGYNTSGEYHLNFGWGAPHPDEITEAWYHLPVEIPSSFNAIQEVVLNIQPTAPGIEVDPASLLFQVAQGEESEPALVYLESASTAFSLIESISCPAGFVVSLTEQGYADHIPSFEMPLPGQAMAIHVKFCPAEAGGYLGAMAINYGAGKTRHVALTGYAIEGGTKVPAGAVSGTWSQAESPYYVLGDIRLPAGGELVVEPGVRVAFAGPYSLTVGPAATLSAEGTASDPIEFTAGDKEIGWKGLRFVESGDDDVLNHCSITFSKKGAASEAEGEAGQGTRGGAVYCYGSHPTIANCRITNNVGDCGGAIYGVDSDLTIYNTVIANNTSMGDYPQSGGISCVGNSYFQIDNCTVVNNFPGGILSSASYWTEVTNTIVWGNGNYQVDCDALRSALIFCDVQGGYSGEGNLDADPCFFDPSRGIGSEYDGAIANWTLRSNSPCINGGAPTATGDTDLAGNTRIDSDLIDLGAFENQSDLPLMTVTPADAFDVGCVPVNTQSAMTLDLTNTGQVDFAVESLSLSDPNGAFSIETPITHHVLLPGDSVEVEIGLTPSEARVYTGVLHVASTSSNAPHKRIALRGVGVSGAIVPGGDVSGTWTRAESPYTVTGDIAVPRGRALTIEPGVEVKFAGHFGLTVGYRATLTALGTADEPILFMPIDTEEGWFGIRFVNTGNEDVLQYCTIEYARKPRTEMSDYANAMGGGIYCGMSYDFTDGVPIPSSPTIDHCLIAHNRADYAGGIMCTDESKAVITHNRIMDNSSLAGGGIWVFAAYPLIANNVIAHNSAAFGGGIYNYYGIPSIVNNTIAHNRPNGLDLDWANLWGMQIVPVLNNIVWGNEIYLWPDGMPGEYDIRFNDIQGGWVGQGNIEVSPAFADPENRDYHLKSEAGRWDREVADWVIDEMTSPCIDAGDPGQSKGDESDSHGDAINMGAYGGTTEASKTPNQ